MEKPHQRYLSKAILLDILYKAFGIWPAGIPQEAVEKPVADYTLAEISSNPR